LLEIKLAEHERGDGGDFFHIEVVADMFARKVGAGGVDQARNEVTSLPTHEFFEFGDEEELDLPEVAKPLAHSADGVAEKIGRVAAAKEEASILERQTS
jgi:hypothetical protein